MSPFRDGGFRRRFWALLSDYPEDHPDRDVAVYMARSLEQYDATVVSMPEGFLDESTDEIDMMPVDPMTLITSDIPSQEVSGG